MELRTYGTRNVFLAQPGRYHEQLAATAMTPQQAEEFATVVSRYFDYESYGRDIRLNGDAFEVSGFYFWSR